MKRLRPMACCALASLLVAAPSRAQNSLDSVTVRVRPVGGSVYIADCLNGFGGGNVAASVGPDGILLVDDMYAAMVPKLQRALAGLSPLPIRVVLNTHFHGDHIQGDLVLGKTATIIAQENVLARVSAGKNPNPFPMVTFAERLTVRFNGENIRLVHYPNGHTDGDAVVYFESSKVLHMGDMFFQGMFPAVYAEGGGNIKQLIANVEQVLADFPADTRVIPGHGDVATMQDLAGYLTMLKETVAAAERNVRDNSTPEAMRAALANDPALRKYARLGDGGAQTLEQYAAMLVKLLDAPSGHTTTVRRPTRTASRPSPSARGAP
jgi:cyclase